MKRSSYEITRRKILEMALSKGKVRLKDLVKSLEHLACKATIINHLNLMVKEGLLKKEKDETTHKPIYRIQPMGTLLLFLEDVKHRLINYLHFLEEVAKVDPSTLSTGEVVAFFEGVVYGLILSFLHSLIFISETIKEDKTVMKEEFILHLTKTSRDKEILSDVFDKMFELSEHWKKIPENEKERLYKEYIGLIPLIKKLKKMRDERLEEIMFIVSNLHLSYITNLLQNNYFQRILLEAVKKNDFSEKAYLMMEPFLEKIYVSIIKLKETAEKDESVRLFLERFKEIYEEIKELRERITRKI